MSRLVALVALALVLCTMTPADAAYPGENGRVAFLSNRGGGGYKLFTMRPDGSDVRLVTRGANLRSPPSWSPGGERLVYTTRGSRLATIRANGAGGRVFTFLGWWGTWSPDGQRLAFENEADGIDIVDAALGRPSGLLKDTGAGDLSKWSPSWSSDGARIA